MTCLDSVSWLFICASRLEAVPRVYNYNRLSRAYNHEHRPLPRRWSLRRGLADEGALCQSCSWTDGPVCLVRPFKEQLSDGHRWDIWEKMRSQQAANAEPAALPPYQSSSSSAILQILCCLFPTGCGNIELSRWRSSWWRWGSTSASPSSRSHQVTTRTVMHLVFLSQWLI